MLDQYDLRKLACLEADIIIQNIELDESNDWQAVEIKMMNEQQLEIIRELKQAALN